MIVIETLKTSFPSKSTYYCELWDLTYFQMDAEWMGSSKSSNYLFPIYKRVHIPLLQCGKLHISELYDCCRCICTMECAMNNFLGVKNGPNFFSMQFLRCSGQLIVPPKRRVMSVWQIFYMCLRYIYTPLYVSIKYLRLVKQCGWREHKKSNYYGLQN
jgi:hypothetical protein